jgi:FixJ family two-component response regulator
VLGSLDPTRALPLIEWEGVDVLISEMYLQPLSGLDFMVRVRQMFPQVARILMSSLSNFETMLRVVNEAEVFRVLRKPLVEADVQEAVERAVDRLDMLRYAETRLRAAAERRQALSDLEPQHPGISTATLNDGFYDVTESRIEDLWGRFRGTGLGPLLPA